MEKIKKPLEIGLTIFVALYNLGLMLLAVMWIFTNWFGCYKASLGTLQGFGVNAYVTYDMFCAGVLGGTFYCLRALYSRLADAYAPSDPTKPKVPMNMTVWAFWYVYRPLQGGVLALILLVLTKSNLLQLQEVNDADSNSLYFLVGVGFFAGFGAHEVMDKISAVIKVIFGSSKDSQNGGSGNSAAGGGKGAGGGAQSGGADQSGGNGNANANSGGNDSQNTKSETPTNEESGASSTEEPSPEENPVNGEGSDQPK